MRIFGAFLAAIAAILVFTGCQSDGGYHVSVGSTPPPPPPPHHEHVGKKHGPPPHAPAHGYRHKHDGCDLRYDRTVGCYAVVGYANYYYNDGFFFRYSDGSWQMSANVGSGWSGVDVVRVPEPLVVKYHGKGHGKGNKGGKGKGKGKGNKHSELGTAVIVEARWGKF
jgi:hypothetical protein